MLNRFMLCLLAVAFCTGLVYAHGDPILGTVTEVKTDTFTIKDKDAKSVVIMLDKKTKYVKDGKPGTKADLKVGVRVVIDAEMDKKMKMYSAEEIKIGTTDTAAPKK